VKVNYWSCPFSDYEDGYNGTGDNLQWACTNPKGNGLCELENKVDDDEEDCQILEFIEEDK